MIPIKKLAALVRHSGLSVHNRVHTKAIDAEDLATARPLHDPLPVLAREDSSRVVMTQPR
jgi:hypothetical protein